MRKNALALLLTSILLHAAAPAAWAGAVKPAPPFTDHMVLQRDVPMPVWGTADAGQRITVAIRKPAAVEGQSPQTPGDSIILPAKTAVADRDGNWSLKLDPLPAGGPFEMTIKGAEANEVVLSDVLVGDVWLCSGQSNMEWPVGRAARAAEEAAEANYPQIRSLLINGPWKVCSPQTVRGFSAASYFFGRELNQALKVPIGLLHESLGGTSARLWTPIETIKALPELKQILADYEKESADYPRRMAAYEEALAQWAATTQAAATQASTAQAATTQPTTRLAAAPGMPILRPPGQLYDTMIRPMIPYAIRGAIWYQGESDSGRPAEYRALFPAMIQSWRKAWGQGDFPFLYVQLPNYGPWDYTRLRAVQQACLSIPNTGMAVTIDIGEKENIHPRNKQDVGKRLALIALKTVYGRKVVCSGPAYDSMTIDGAKVRVKFKELGGGLMAKSASDANPAADANAAAGAGVKAVEVAGFAIAGEDKKFLPAQAKIDGDSVVVWGEGVAKPAAVRYAWEADPKCNLYNKDGLPAAPFRTDDW